MHGNVSNRNLRGSLRCMELDICVRLSPCSLRACRCAAVGSAAARVRALADALWCRVMKSMRSCVEPDMYRQ